MIELPVQKSQETPSEQEVSMSVEATANSDRELAMKTIAEMAPDASLQEISEELSILAAIRRGEAAANSGRVISHEEMKRRSAAWTTK
jgi:predicted transcriptional regulator